MTSNPGLFAFPTVLHEVLAVNPTAPASTSAFKMQGLGVLFTPVRTGMVFCKISAHVVATTTTTTVGSGIIVQGMYGAIVSGTAPPANASAPLGSAVTFTAARNWASGVTFTTTEDAYEPIEVAGVIPGLQIGQQYWFDLQAESLVTASLFGLANVQVDAFEIT